MSDERRASEIYVQVPGGRRTHLSDVSKEGIDGLVARSPREGWLFARSLAQIVENLLNDRIRENTPSAESDPLPEHLQGNKRLRRAYARLEHIREGLWAELRGESERLQFFLDFEADPDGPEAVALALAAAVAEIEVRQLINGETPG